MKRTVRSGFFPVEPLKGKKNYKRFFRINRDASVVEMVFLNIPESRQREDVIFFHYMRNYGKLFSENDFGLNLLSRDNPWDYEVQLSNGLSFNIEITSIAESSKLFEIQSKEERFDILRHKKQVRLRDLEKIEKFFPDEGLNKIIQEYRQAGTTKDCLVKNPLLNSGGRLFLSHIEDTGQRLSAVITDSIRKKELKSHKGKENTVIVIDNRASLYDVDDFYEAQKELKDFLEDSIFPEIWFYTGYYSDLDGNNAEFSFAPLKLRKEQLEAFASFAEKCQLDKYGRAIW